MAETFGGAVSDGVSALEVAEGRTIRLLTNHAGGTLELFRTTVDLGDSTNAIVELDAAGALQSIVPFGESGSTAFDLASGASGTTYVTGGYGDPLGELNQRGARIVRMESNGPAGEKRLATGYSVSEVVVDAQGGIWLSGGWGTRFEWNGATQEPVSPIAEEACRFVLRASSF